MQAEPHLTEPQVAPVGLLRAVIRKNPASQPRYTIEKILRAVCVFESG